MNAVRSHLALVHNERREYRDTPYFQHVRPLPPVLEAHFATDDGRAPDMVRISYSLIGREIDKPGCVKDRDKLFEAMEVVAAWMSRPAPAADGAPVHDVPDGAA